jgi:hypothetical protein
VLRRGHHLQVCRIGASDAMRDRLQLVEVRDGGDANPREYDPGGDFAQKGAMT